MTNAEKYLKDGIDLEEFSKSIMTWYFGNYAKANDFARIKNWAEHKIETLTEDEKVILRNTTANTCNAKNHYITRTKGSGRVRIKFKEDGEEGYFNFAGFDHLFQFIKEGEEYPIEELLKGE